MTEPRYIDMTPTWRVAAQIIAAALENGTETGRDAARAELFRMADLLDALNEERQQAATAEERQAEAIAEGRKAEAEGRRVIHVHGRPYADPADEGRGA